MLHRLAPVRERTFRGAAFHPKLLGFKLAAPRRFPARPFRLGTSLTARAVDVWRRQASGRSHDPPPAPTDVLTPPVGTLKFQISSPRKCCRTPPTSRATTRFARTSLCTSCTSASCERPVAPRSRPKVRWPREIAVRIRSEGVPVRRATGGGRLWRRRPQDGPGPARGPRHGARARGGEGFAQGSVRLEPVRERQRRDAEPGGHVDERGADGRQCRHALGTDVDSSHNVLGPC